jgi:hypothetical protein
MGIPFPCMLIVSDEKKKKNLFHFFFYYVIKVSEILGRTKFLDLIWDVLVSYNEYYYCFGDLYQLTEYVSGITVII